MIDENKLIKVLKDEMLRMEFDERDESYNFGIDTAIFHVQAQPKVGEWISVEERLPKEAGVYRVTCLYDDKVYRVKDDLFYSDRTWGYDNHHPNRKVIAWKPLEKPYEVKENG